MTSARLVMLEPPTPGEQQVLHDNGICGLVATGEFPNTDTHKGRFQDEGDFARDSFTSARGRLVPRLDGLFTEGSRTDASVEKGLVRFDHSYEGPGDSMGDVTFSSLRQRRSTT